MDLKSLVQKKKDLTKDVRKAGITGQDEAFLNNFSDTMTTNESSSKKEEYVPSDKEIDQTLNKAK